MSRQGKRGDARPSFATRTKSLAEEEQAVFNSLYEDALARKHRQQQRWSEKENQEIVEIEKLQRRKEQRVSQGSRSGKSPRQPQYRPDKRESRAERFESRPERSESKSERPEARQSLRQSTPRQSAARQSTGRQSTPRQSAPRQSSPRQSSPRTGASRQSTAPLPGRRVSGQRDEIGPRLPLAAIRTRDSSPMLHRPRSRSQDFASEISPANYNNTSFVASQTSFVQLRNPSQQDLTAEGSPSPARQMLIKVNGPSQEQLGVRGEACHKGAGSVPVPARQTSGARPLRASGAANSYSPPLSGPCTARMPLSARGPTRMHQTAHVRSSSVGRMPRSDSNCSLASHASLASVSESFSWRPAETSSWRPPVAKQWQPGMAAPAIKICTDSTRSYTPPVKYSGVENQRVVVRLSSGQSHGCLVAPRPETPRQLTRVCDENATCHTPRLLAAPTTTTPTSAPSNILADRTNVMQTLSMGNSAGKVKAAVQAWPPCKVTHVH